MEQSRGVMHSDVMSIIMIIIYLFGIAPHP